ncbi:hypothetical protein DNTS_004411 [Danionella cerebrum]|uniref:Uncharacterized protein n=1 Tax=Danionella cerebrum TaxID=2873325 RepID=A0A553NHC3_9TELE|nr:hypothetical protein DNTS_004411 [Danionella translucida]
MDGDVEDGVFRCAQFSTAITDDDGAWVCVNGPVFRGHTLSTDDDGATSDSFTHIKRERERGLRRLSSAHKHTAR